MSARTNRTALERLMMSETIDSKVKVKATQNGSWDWIMNAHDHDQTQIS